MIRCEHRQYERKNMYRTLTTVHRYTSSFVLNVGRLYVYLFVDIVPRSRAFQPRLAPWVARLGDATGRTLSLMPRRVVTVACGDLPTIPRRSPSYDIIAQDKSFCRKIII